MFRDRTPNTPAGTPQNSLTTNVDCISLSRAEGFTEEGVVREVHYPIPVEIPELSGGSKY
jgi:hypothetical protein